MKRLLVIISLLLTVSVGFSQKGNMVFLKSIPNLVEIPVKKGAKVNIRVSNSIVSPDIIGESGEDPLLLAVFGISNGQDGSEFVGKIFKGTNFFKKNPESWSFTCNSNSDKIWAIGIGSSPISKLKRKFDLKVNGLNYEISPENMIFLNSLQETANIPYNKKDVTIKVSNSIVSPDISGKSGEDPQLLAVFGVSNREDGSEFIGRIFKGTNYFSQTQEVWNFTSNSNSNKVRVFAVGFSESNNLERHFVLNVNGVEHKISPYKSITNKAESNNPDKNQPPIISILNPLKENNIVFTKIINVSGKAKDDDGIFEVRVNDIDANINEKGMFSINVPLAVGKNIIKVKALDPKMNSSTVSLTVYRKSNQNSEDKIDNTLTNPDEKTQKKVALIFGNSTYKGAADLGENPINDAKDIATTLESLGFEVLLKTDANLNTMNNTIREFGRRNKDTDIALFYFAGHGMQVDKVNYLLPVNINIQGKNDVSFECISVETIQRIMETNNEDRLNIIILDACRNNPFRTWHRGGDEGLADISPPSGTLIAFSTSPGSFAENGSGRNGLYTGELIKQLKIAQRIEDVFINTRVQVEKKSGGHQSPWELAKLRGKYFLVK